MVRRGWLIGATVALAATCATVGGTATASTRLAGIHKIQHVVVIMQENRTFDSYFGTYPGANGLPSVCVPDPRAGKCQRPYHDRSDVNSGGPHDSHASVTDIDNGRMDGFVNAAEGASRCVGGPNNPRCKNGGAPDVMGYHNGADIPNYWAYAKSFVLQDRMFASEASWSLPNHLALVSAWSATCTVPLVAASCRDSVNEPTGVSLLGASTTSAWPAVHFDWTDLTYLLHRANVTWRYYLGEGRQPDCAEGEMVCKPVAQRTGVPGIWNPLPAFTTVHEDGQTGDVVSGATFANDAATGHLPKVSWVVPNQADSEHPPAHVSTGQSYVTRMINAAMSGPDWKSTAIFVTWDDWGGFYDHVRPPAIDSLGYGIRVPGLLISPYARAGFVDHQTLSFDAFAKFIEDDFLSSQRLDPATDKRPDPRPSVREDAPILGNLVSEFDFTQKPRPPLLLPERPRTDMIGVP